jgi:glycosyltransferase involved in cell wall biosynthesis
LAGIKKKLGIENNNNFQIISLKSANKFVWNLWTLPNYLRHNPVGIYHTQYILPFFIDKKIKLITLIHDVSFRAYPELIKWSDLFFLKILIPWSLKRANKILTASEFTKKEIEKYYHISPEKIAVVLNSGGEDLQAEISPEELRVIKEKYQLPEKFILYLGTMQPRKNLPVLLKAIAELKTAGWKVVLAGKRNAYHQDPQIEKTIKELSLEKEVIFTDFVKEREKAALFKLARVFCSPALYEGFDIPLLEAMRAGTPAVVSDIPPHREVAGETALYFSSRDTVELTDKIVYIDKNKDLRERLIREAKTKAQNFAWKKTAEKTLEIYLHTHNHPL